MDTMSSMLSGYPCQARSQKECHGVTHVLSIERYMYTQAMTQGSQKLRKWMTLCNLRRQKTLLKDYSMRVKHQTDRLIKISGVDNSSIRVCDDSGHRKCPKSTLTSVCISGLIVEKRWAFCEDKQNCPTPYPFTIFHRKGSSFIYHLILINN